MKLTKTEALKDFREMWTETVRQDPRWRSDSIAKREAFNNYIDALHKDALITNKQVATWTNPF